MVLVFVLYTAAILKIPLLEWVLMSYTAISFCCPPRRLTTFVLGGGVNSNTWFVLLPDTSMYMLLIVASGHAPLSPIPKNFRIDHSCINRRCANDRSKKFVHWFTFDFTISFLLYIYIFLIYFVLPDLCPSSCRISMKQFVAVPETFSCKLRRDISVENVFQLSDNLCYECELSLTMSLDLSMDKEFN